MGSIELRKRATWQDYSGMNAAEAEANFQGVFSEAFGGTDFRIRRDVTEFTKIYVNVQLNKTTSEEIYNPPDGVDRHGVRPDYAIDNPSSGKTLYVEVKRQDGWVEGKPRSAGRGNAHERSCKYFTPGLLNTLRQVGRLGDNVLPFWTVFIGDITRDPCRVREITLWYTGCEAHFFMWRNTTNPLPLLNHFDEHLKKLLL